MMGEEQAVNGLNGHSGANGTNQLPAKKTAQTTFQPTQPNPALYTNEKREIFMGQSPELKPDADDCVVRMRANGICG